MTPDQFTEFLRREIPLVAAMDARVLRIDEGEIEIGAPLAPNSNLHGTAFAGSLAALGLICGWCAVHRAISAAGLTAQLVAQNSECAFVAPATQALRGVATISADDAAQMVNALQRKGRARLQVMTQIHADATLVATHRGTYVAKLTSHS